MSPAAADLPVRNILRGPLLPSYIRWEGLYLGGMYGHTSMTTDFESATAGLPQTTSTGSSYGGFIGYNIQWDDLVVGFEGNYSRADALETVATNGTSNGSFKLKDYGSLRGRAGYVFGQFMPYAFVGGVVGRADYSVTSLGTLVETKTDAYVGGVSAGIGLDLAILPNVFVRGEWEYIAFSEIGDTRSSMNTARVGLGVRF